MEASDKLWVVHKVELIKYLYKKYSGYHMGAFPQELKEEFSVSFQVSENSIDAHQLANSLLGITTLLEIANEKINGENSKIFVNVDGGFREGSFQFDIIALMAGPVIISLVNTVDIIGFTGKTVDSVLSYIEFLRYSPGREITKLENIDTDKRRVYVKGDNNGTIVYAPTINIYNDLKARQNTERVFFPLMQGEIPSVEFKKGTRESLKITKEEFPYFVSPEPEISEDENIAELNVTQSNLLGKESGWRFSFNEDGSDDFRADVKDVVFLKLVKSGFYKFSKGDFIKAKYSQIQQKKERRTNQWIIERVLESNGEHVEGNLLEKYNK